jgi:cell wall-associated NlpC family hydrolase
LNVGVFPLKKLLLVACLVLLVSACATKVPEIVQVKKPVAPAPVVMKPSWHEASLLEFHNEWRGTPYRLGGLSKKGLDCSGMVYLAYKDIVGQYLPRTVMGQKVLGKEIKRHELRIGDLVFFKVSRRTQHVGIYVGNNNFLHASTKKGVKISSMNNVYWAPRYWTAKRLEDVGLVAGGASSAVKTAR